MMSKRAIFTESQQNIINESIKVNEVITTLPQHLLSDIAAGNIPFDKDVPVEKIAAKRFLDVKSQFTDDITQYDNGKVVTELNRLIQKTIKKEKNLKKQLEAICLNNIVEAFKMPEDGIDFAVDLCEEVSRTQQFHITPDTDEEYEYEDVNEINSEDIETKKRKLINALIVGGSMKMSEIIEKKCLQDIFEIDEELPHLYSKIMKINDYLIFNAKFDITDKSHKQGGYVTVKIGDDMHSSKIVAKGILFPILLREAVRGCLELWAAHGLPESKREAMAVINKADALENDPWYMRVGPVLWERACGNVDFEGLKYIPSFFMKFTTLNAQEFCDIVNEIAYNTKKGKSEIDSLISNAKYDDDYSDFEDDLKAKQSEKGIIADDCFTEQELEEAAYPSNFNVEEFRNLRSFRERVQYCAERLQKLGQGSSRIVYLVDENTVLKLAKNKKGLAQNIAEQGDYYMRQIGLFAEVYDYDENGLWIEMERCRRAKPSDFKAICGYDFSVVCDWIDYCHQSYTRNRYARMYGKHVASEPIFNSDEFQENYEYSIFSMLQDYLGNYCLESIGDLKRLSTWGVNSKNELVVIDYGLTDDVAEEFYSFRR